MNLVPIYYINVLTMKKGTLTTLTHHTFTNRIRCKLSYPNMLNEGKETNEQQAHVFTKHMA